MDQIIKAVPSTNTGDQDSAESSAPPPGLTLQTDHDDEALALGLPGSVNKSQQSREATAKKRSKKRSQEEILQQEYQKSEDEVGALLRLLPNFLENKSFGQELGKVDRGLTKKIKDCNDLHLFDYLDPLKKLSSKVDALRAATKHARVFIGGGMAAKKIGKEFVNSLEKLQEVFPEAAHLLFCVL